MSDEGNPQQAPTAHKLQTPIGMHDILPDDHEFFTFIKKVVRHRARQCGFRRITTPILEATEVFQRGIGDATDIVDKEMYTFTDKGDRSMTLKPEGTAGVVRSYIEHGMKELPQPVQLYYIEPHFRYDKPQKGRYRQFWQFGIEIIGETDPALDAQIIDLANRINEDLGIAHLFQIQINNIGCPKCRTKYKEELVNFYIGKERSLCENCQDRLHKNPLRLLDCKAEDCRILAELAPKFEQYRCPTCVEFHTKLKGYLDELKIEYVENPKLVRGLDYYTGTVFEFWDKTEGAQNAIGGGGRYDGLTELMGGQPTPAVGYAAGLERIIGHMHKEGIKVPSKDDLHIFVAQLGDDAKKKCLTLLNQLRERGIKAVGALGKGSMKAQMRLADKFKVPYTLIMGITEVREGVVIVRNMQKGQQRPVPFDEVVEEVVKLIGEENLDKYSPGELLY
ncbi:histidine--tRNA ligase [Candidatus Peregrinibacteria bacterium RIFOXYB12_FULL_41_12]|nr:MAG: histidine--tRNA ligase [Candidatus Peregrinibacteria bacterium RIFOXYA2_FULL_41_18]OGJ48820.1 MAG: histidine--tRNA ligase [Candidatus Peregrinibacteria bacterium RIFOXYB12_FULL_41_12]